jgi:lipopolysaccharide export system permease protein
MGTSIDNVLIIDRTGNGERRVIIAKNAELKDAGKDGLSLDLQEAFVQSSKEIARQDYDYASSGFLRYWVPQEDIMQAVSSIGANQMSSADVWKEIIKKEENLRLRLDEHYGKTLERAMSLELSLRRGGGDESWNRRANLLQALVRETEAAASIKQDRSLLIYRLEFYKKFSLPFGALAFVFLAVPLGLLAKKSGQTVGFIFGLIIAVIYWALLLGGQSMGVRLGYPPFWCMWLPDILAVVIGVFMCVIRMRK